MKNTIHGRVIVILIALLLCVGLFASCNKTPDTPQESESNTETEAPTVMYDIVKDGKTDYKIIKADTMNASVASAASDVWRKIYIEYDVEIEFTSDYSVDNRDNETVETGSDVREILIGGTNRRESRRRPRPDRSTRPQLQAYPR